jgi:uncharacterized protein (DUF433 family)
MFLYYIECGDFIEFTTAKNDAEIVKKYPNKTIYKIKAELVYEQKHSHFNDPIFDDYSKETH